MIFHVKLEESDGWVVAECPALPNVKEAIVAWLWVEDQKAVA